MTEDTAKWFPGWWAEQQPDRPAVVMADTGIARTYGQLDAVSNQMSRLLRKLGLQVGDHVAMWFENEVDYPALWFGARYAGLYYTLISSRLTPEEVAFIVRDSGSRVLLIGSRLAQMHGPQMAELLDPTPVILDSAAPGCLRALLSAESPTPLAERTEGLPMLYSSGTTGFPKAVKRPLSGAPLGTSQGAVGMAQRVGIDADAVYLSPAPLYHAAPLGYVSAVLALGGTVVIQPKFDAEGFLAAVERYRVTHTQMVPTMFIRLLSLSDETKRRYSVATLQAVLHSGAPCPIPVKKQMFEWLGPIIHEYYSGTENVGYTYCSPNEWLGHPGTVGRPVGCQVHIVGEGGEELPNGVDGDVYFSGSNPFEYHNDPLKTKEAFRANGQGTFGDIGHLDDDGYLYLTDRKANMIIVGGVNVYPQEAENLLVTHPLVRDAAVFGVPHPEYGEEVIAVVEPKNKVDNESDLEAELIAYCRSHLATVKCPRSVAFRDDMPREPTGKLLKRKLRDEWCTTLPPRPDSTQTSESLNQ
jgi:long-chain acyl-CoA synthetase